jgi:enamine deaminase RidA (YjgF/YER057c/UK114 family)
VALTARARAVLAPHFPDGRFGGSSDDGSGGGGGGGANVGLAVQSSTGTVEAATTAVKVAAVAAAGDDAVEDDDGMLSTKKGFYVSQYELDGAAVEDAYSRYLEEQQQQQTKVGSCLGGELAATAPALLARFAPLKANSSSSRSGDGVGAGADKNVAEYVCFAGLMRNNGSSGSDGEEAGAASPVEISPAAEAQMVVDKLHAALAEKGLTANDVMLVHLYVSSMAQFGAINAVYINTFGLEPPARVCLETLLPVFALC